MSVVVRQHPALLDVNPPLVAGNPEYHELTEKISAITEGKVRETPRKYWIALSITGSILLMLGGMLAYLVSTGIGVWGNNRPIGWAWDITNFVYGTVSALFWFTGLVPDLATLRDRATTAVRQKVFGFLSLGWRGSARHWRNYEAAYLILAGISTPLVLSVHSVVSFDFATSVIPGWHTTIFPPYFVAGAIFSGFAMVMTLLLISRWLLDLDDLITMKHLENMNKIMLVTGSVVGYAYATEFFIAWYSGNMYERFTFINRATGPYWWAYWTMVSCNVISPQFFWFKKMRRSLPVMFVLSIVINIGMWFERFVIIVTSLHRDYLPSSWGMFSPTWVDICTFIGTFGLFLTLFLLFARFLPMIAIAEVKGVLANEKHAFAEHNGGHH